MSDIIKSSKETITLKSGEDNVVKYFKGRARVYILFELINLAIVVLITVFSIYLLGGGKIGEYGLETSGDTIVSVTNRIVFLSLLLFVAKIFLRFQEYNTRRASLMNTIADAWSISDNKKEFVKMIKALSPTQYESIKKTPDFKSFFSK